MPPKRKGRFIKAWEKKRREISCEMMREIRRQDAANHDTSTIEYPVIDTIERSANDDSVTDSDAANTPDSVTKHVPADPETGKWRDGRVIVEMGTLSDQLRSCSDCGLPLHLHRIQSEKKYGLSSLFYIQCECGVMNAVTTSKQHRSASATRGVPVNDINTKAALGMYHSGIGHTQMNNFLSSLEIHGLHHTSLKAREVEISQHIQTVAQDSCDAALQEESDVATIGYPVSTSMQSENATGTQTEENGRPQGQFKYDMGWQKRGSGRSYDSKSGVGTMIGNSSGKICAYGVRVAGCRMCTYHENKGQTAPAHKCHKNWSGSSKAMEPDVGGELVQQIEAKGVDVGIIIMDDDTTTMARIRREITHAITKWSDRNHTSKHLGNSLYSLQKKHKVLQTPVIKWLQKCFGYALSQNKGHVDNCRSAILQIVPHAFGEHNTCGSWCGFLKNPETYRHASLSKDLSGEILRQDLESVFQVFANNAEKIAPGGSTKDVESFNNMVAAKAPKRIHFSGSGSLNSRVDCAVAQKNIGNVYLNKVNVAAGLSPGIVFQEHALKKDRTRKRQLEYSSSRSFKKRRIEQKLKKRSAKCVKELREGVTYQSAVANTHHADIQEIPPPTIAPAIEHVTEHIYQKLFCDIETSSLHHEADILQISAVCGTDTFDQYITPTKSVAPAASAVTGLTSQGGVLFHNGTPVPTLPLKGAMQNFLAWLDDRAPAILIGHNFRAFDFPRIIRALDLSKLNAAFQEVVVGAVDTLPLFKEVYPGRTSYKQEELVSQILHEAYEAHNAVADVTSLQKLFAKTDVSEATFFRHSFTSKWGFQLLAYKQKTMQNMDSLEHLVQGKIVSKAMAEKIGRSGLRYPHLALAFSRSGVEGLTHLLSEKVNGSRAPRVTSTKRIIEQIAMHFAGQAGTKN